MSRAVRSALVSASLADVKELTAWDEKEGEHYTSLPVAQVRDVVDELERLREIEAVMLDAIAWKKTQAAAERHLAVRLGQKCMVEASLVCKQEARKIDAEVFELERILEGKRIA